MEEIGPLSPHLGCGILSKKPLSMEKRSSTNPPYLRCRIRPKKPSSMEKLGLITTLLEMWDTSLETLKYRGRRSTDPPLKIRDTFYETLKYGRRSSTDRPILDARYNLRNTMEFQSEPSLWESLQGLDISPFTFSFILYKLNMISHKYGGRRSTEPPPPPLGMPNTY